MQLSFLICVSEAVFVTNSVLFAISLLLAALLHSNALAHLFDLFGHPLVLLFERVKVLYHFLMIVFASVNNWLSPIAVNVQWVTASTN